MSAPRTTSVAAPTSYEVQRLERLMRHARLLARSAFCAAPVRELFGQLALLHQALVEVPDRLMVASQTTAAGLLRRHAQDLDRVLYGSPWQDIEELYGVAVGRDARLAGLETILPPHIETQQLAAREILRRRGIERIAPSPGSQPDPRDTTPANRPPLLTGQAHLAGRIARVAPGDGGWRLDGEVIRPALVQFYAAAELMEQRAAG